MSIWRDRPTYVTGATGLVGGWVVQRLVSQGAHVICLVRDWEPRSQLLTGDWLSKVTVVRGDVTDQTLQERALNEYEVQTVIHLAAQTIVGIANRNPVSTFEANIKGTWALLEACRRSPTVRQVVVASSDKAYGEQAELPYSEETPLQGAHPYDVSKSCADLLATSYAVTFDLPVVVTRCGNFFGGGDLNWNRIVPGTIRSVLRGESPVIRSDGSFVRDYFYVEEGADAYLLLAEKLAADDSLRGHAFNFSYGQPMTVVEIAQKILDKMGSTLRLDIRSHATHEIARQYLSAEKARRTLRWTPTLSLDEGIERTVRWYRAFIAGS